MKRTVEIDLHERDWQVLDSLNEAFEGDAFQHILSHAADGVRREGRAECDFIRYIFFPEVIERAKDIYLDEGGRL